MVLPSASAILLEALTSKITVYALLAVSVLLGMGWLFLECELTEAKKEIAACHARAEAQGTDLGAAQAKEEQLRSDLNVQTLQVEEWLLEAERQAERAQQAEFRSQQIRVITQTKIERILVAPVPADCEGAVRWGAGEAARIGGEWSAGRTTPGVPK